MDPSVVTVQLAGRSGSVPKRLRPPNLSLATDRRSNTIIELESPVIVLPDEDEDELYLSSPSSSTSSSSPVGSLPNVDTDSDPTSDGMSQDLAVLEKLRKNVRENLRLRPIQSTGALPKVDLQKSPFTSPSNSWHDSSPQIAPSPTLTSASPSVYFTPLLDDLTLPLSARYLGTGYPPNLSSLHPAQPLDPGTVFDRLTSSKRPLLIDTRPPPSHVTSHILHSINIAVPSLILKRCRRPGGGFQSLDALRQFITTEQGKDAWDRLIGRGDSWDNNVIVYDEDMDTTNLQVAAWALIPVITPLLSQGSVYFLRGGISAARDHRCLQNLILSGGDFDFGGDALQAPSQVKKGSGLFQLDVESATRSKPYPDIARQPGTPLPIMSSVISSSVKILDSPSPPPSQLAFHHPRPPQRRPSAPNLRRLDTKSAERLNTNLPKLHLRTIPVKSATLSVPPLHISVLPHSPSLSLAHSNHSPLSSAQWTPSPDRQNDFQTTPFSSYFTPPLSPQTPMPLPPSPATARPEPDQPPTTEEHAEEFSISAILPNFLFLGPELTTREHLEECQELGIKRILNMAAECEDDKGLHLKEVFERYVKIPWRDTVEEENIAKGVREVCEILDDARLHSAPTYVHCRAGKSRSVTAVMAYLIHANHWTLSQAYAFVVERRKGISPNIGFVSELMTFEEEELGGKSNGVQPSASGEQAGEHHDNGGHGSFAAVGSRRAGHIRESLPPVFVTQNSEGNFIYTGPMSADPVSNARVGDSGQEMEIKDSSGRYRHARRAPVDEQTLQPLRRVSKAGLESLTLSVLGS